MYWFSTSYGIILYPIFDLYTRGRVTTAGLTHEKKTDINVCKH